MYYELLYNYKLLIHCVIWNWGARGGAIFFILFFRSRTIFEKTKNTKNIEIFQLTCFFLFFSEKRKKYEKTLKKRVFLFRSRSIFRKERRRKIYMCYPNKCVARDIESSEKHILCHLYKQSLIKLFPRRGILTGLHFNTFAPPPS